MVLVDPLSLQRGRPAEYYRCTYTHTHTHNFPDILVQAVFCSIGIALAIA